MKYLLKSKWFFDGITDNLIYNAVLMIDDGKISFFGPEELIKDLSQAKTFNYGDATIMPGLIDSHVHLTLDGSPDPIQKIKSSNDSVSKVLSAINNAKKHINAGVTTIRDCGSPDLIPIEIAKATESGLLFNVPSILASGPVICITGGHGYFMGIEADGVDEVRKSVRTAIKNGASFIKLIATGGVITPGSKTGVTQFDLEELSVAVKEASKVGLLTAAHAHGDEGIKYALKAGVSTIEHASYVKEETISLFLQTNAIVVSTLLASRQQKDNLDKVPKYVAEKIIKHLKIETESIKKMIDAGVPIAGGTDAGTPFNQHGELPEQLKILTECGMENIQALKAGTYFSSLALGIQDYKGTLETGKRADILVVKGNPVKDLKALNNVIAVWKSGECIFENNTEGREKNNG